MILMNGAWLRRFEAGVILDVVLGWTIFEHGLFACLRQGGSWMFLERATASCRIPPIFWNCIYLLDGIGLGGVGPDGMMG